MLGFLAEASEKRAGGLLVLVWLAALRPTPALAGASWAPIPAEVWAMKEDPAGGTVGAVVLENRIAFENNRIQYTYRARILSAQGRDAAEFPPFTSSAYGFDGRTVQPDGKVVAFSTKKDFETVTVKSRFGSGTVSRLVPPGVSDDCVVELRWYESAQDAVGPLPPEYGFFHEWTLGHRYRTLASVLDIPKTFPWAYDLRGVDAYKPDVKDQHLYTVRDLPPVERVPLSLDSLRGLPRLTVFWQPGPLRPYVGGGHQEYWNAVGRLVLKDWLGKASKGSDYQALSRELLQGLPDGPRRKALALREKLDGRIVNLDSLTIAERAKRSEDLAKTVDPSDLGAAARRGSTTGHGMFLLLLHLAKDAGLKPTVVLVADREERIFRPTLLAPFQLDHYLIGVSEPTRPTLWLDPTARFAGAVIRPEYQGTSGLEVDTDEWTLKQTSIPAQPAAYNVRRYTYQLDLGEEEDQLRLKAEFSGYPDWAERWRFLKLEPAEQSRRLKEDLEKEITGAEVTHAQVDNAQSPDQGLAWTAEARIEVEPGRRRTVSLFRAMPWPLWVPTAELAATRTVPIVMSYLQAHGAKATVTYPAGHRLITGGPVQQSNSLGSVTLSIRQTAPATVEAVLRVEITTLVLPAASYGELKDFIGWVQDACGRTFILENQR